MKSFEDDFIYRMHVPYAFYKLGELTAHLSDDFKNCYSEIPWNKIKGLRNVVAHDYGSLNIEKLWEHIEQKYLGIIFVLQKHSRSILPFESAGCG